MPTRDDDSPSDVPAAGGVQALVRGFELLEAVRAAGGEAGLSELATSTGMAPATLHRLARTLVHLGHLRQLASRRYILGPALANLGEAASRMLGRWAGPELAGLVEATGETANLAVLDRDAAVYVAQAPSQHSVRMFTEIGRRVPLHCTGVGKALLATLPARDADATLGRTGLTRVTASTVTDPAVLRAELAACRDRGHVLDLGEQEAGVRCVAAPVCGPEGPHGAVAVSVSGPQGRLDDTAAERAAPLVVAAAARLRTVLHARTGDGPDEPRRGTPTGRSGYSRRSGER